MPYLPPVTVDYYDPVELVLQFARVIANDCAISLAGNLLSDDQPATMPMLNLAWRKLQDRLRNNAVEKFPTEVIIPAIPVINPAVQTDPAIQVWISSSGYWDGATLWPNITLPPNFQIPVKVWERASGQEAQFIPMFPASSGMPSTPKSSYSRLWEWRDDALYFIGALQVNDLRIRYKQYIPDLPNTAAPVTIIRAAVALAYLVVEIFAEGRGSTVTQVFSAEKEDAIKQLINTTTQKKQRENFRRIPYSRRGNLRW
jgi:hypothetical protein